MGYLDIKSLHSETFTETDGNTPKDGVGAASLVLSWESMNVSIVGGNFRVEEGLDCSGNVWVAQDDVSVY